MYAKVEHERHRLRLCTGVDGSVGNGSGDDGSDGDGSDDGNDGAYSGSFKSFSDLSHPLHSFLGSSSISRNLLK